jgi:hypothetical protein
MARARRTWWLPVLVLSSALAACGDGDDTAAPTPSTASTPSPPPASSPADQGTTGGIPTGTLTGGAVRFDDQSGDGTSAVVAEVVAPVAGFVVVAREDAPDDVLGSAGVPAGTSADVRVPLDPPLPADAELAATLYADGDGNGAFDPSADPALPSPRQERDRDGEGDHSPDRDRDGSHDTVSDDAAYRLA